MTGSALGQPLDPERAMDWVRGSLARGSDLARLVTLQLPRLTNAHVLAPQDKLENIEPIFDDNGRGLPSSGADEVARQFLRRLGQKHPTTLVVEDDLARRGDPHVGRAAFVDNRIIRWEEILGDGGTATKLLRSGASGYPLNAFICRSNPGQLGLQSHHELTIDEQERLVASTYAVIVSIWDAEAYVALVSPELEFALFSHPD